MAVSVGDLFGKKLGFPGFTSIVPIDLPIVLIVYLRAGGRLAFYGVRSVQPGTLSKGLAPDLDLQIIVYAILLMAAVGCIEERLFRGRLLQTLRMRGSLNRAIIISGVAFGLGHVVTLLRGYSLTDQALQVVAAVLIGLALEYCVELTGSNPPGAAFHVLFNISGTITAHFVLRDHGGDHRGRDDPLHSVPAESSGQARTSGRHPVSYMA